MKRCHVASPNQSVGSLLNVRQNDLPWPHKGPQPKLAEITGIPLNGATERSAPLLNYVRELRSFPPKRAARDPGCLRRIPRPLRAVAGASIAPPNLREMVEIVPPHRRAARAYLFRPATPTVRAWCMRSAALVTYRLAAPSSSNTAQAMMARKMRSMVVNPIPTQDDSDRSVPSRARPARDPSRKAMWRTGVPLDGAGSGGAPPSNLRETTRIVPGQSCSCHEFLGWLGPQRSWLSSLGKFRMGSAKPHG